MTAIVVALREALKNGSILDIFKREEGPPSFWGKILKKLTEQIITTDWLNEQMNESKLPQ